MYCLMRSLVNTVLDFLHYIETQITNSTKLGYLFGTKTNQIRLWLTYLFQHSSWDPMKDLLCIQLTKVMIQIMPRIVKRMMKRLPKELKALKEHKVSCLSTIPMSSLESIN